MLSGSFSRLVSFSSIFDFKCCFPPPRVRSFRRRPSNLLAACGTQHNQDDDDEDNNDKETKHIDNPPLPTSQQPILPAYMRSIPGKEIETSWTDKNFPPEPLSLGKYSYHGVPKTVIIGNKIFLESVLTTRFL